MPDTFFIRRQTRVIVKVALRYGCFFEKGHCRIIPHVRLLLSWKRVSARKYLCATCVVSRKSVQDWRVRCHSYYRGNACHWLGVLALCMLYRSMASIKNLLNSTQGRKISPPRLKGKFPPVHKLGNRQKWREEKAPCPRSKKKTTLNKEKKQDVGRIINYTIEDTQTRKCRRAS